MNGFLRCEAKYLSLVAQLTTACETTSEPGIQQEYQSGAIALFANVSRVLSLNINAQRNSSWNGSLLDVLHKVPAFCILF